MWLRDPVTRGRSVYLTTNLYDKDNKTKIGIAFNEISTDKLNQLFRNLIGPASTFVLLAMLDENCIYLLVL